MILLLAVLLVGGALRAQVIGVEPADRKVAAKCRKWIIERDGRQLICGEPLVGVRVRGDRIQWPGKPPYMTLLVWDPARPDREITRIDRKGNRRILSDRFRLTLKKGEFRRNKFVFAFRYQTLAGLREEYMRKKARVDALHNELKRKKLGSPQWFEVHRKLVGGMDTLAQWLEATLYEPAAQKLRREMRKVVATAKGEASQTRLEVARAALADYPIPEKLLETCRRAGHGNLTWHGRQTQHLRIVSTDEISPELQQRALETGETIIEGVRSSLVDPLLGAGDRDPIPAGLFKEYYFCLDNTALKVALYEGYFGKNIGTPRERRIKLHGHSSRGGIDGCDYMELWRRRDDLDLEGVVAHGLGHSLANAIYNLNRSSPVPSWLAEGFAYWVSYEFLSRNSVTCFAFSMPRYAKQADKEGVKVVEMGARESFNHLALRKGPPLDQLLRMKLVEMSTADLCKAWSFLDFLLHEHAEKADGFLKSACHTMRSDGRMDLEVFRKRAQQLFPVEQGADVYRHLDRIWREFATTDQLRRRR